MLLTHGSPVGRLYRRFFPDYFGDGVITAVGRHISEGTPGGSPRWLNLHRLTDYIGGPIFMEDDSVPWELEGRVEDLLLDDPEKRMHPAGEPAPGMKAHSDYLRQTVAKERLAGMLQELVVESRPPASGDASCPRAQIPHRGRKRWEAAVLAGSWTSGTSRRIGCGEGGNEL